MTWSRVKPIEFKINSCLILNNDAFVNQVARKILIIFKGLFVCWFTPSQYRSFTLLALQQVLFTCQIKNKQKIEAKSLIA